MPVPLVAHFSTEHYCDRAQFLWRKALPQLLHHLVHGSLHCRKLPTLPQTGLRKLLQKPLPKQHRYPLCYHFWVGAFLQNQPGRNSGVDPLLVQHSSHRGFRAMQSPCDSSQGQPLLAELMNPVVYGFSPNSQSHNLDYLIISCLLTTC